MAELHTLFAAVDQLPPDELEQLHHYIEQRRRLTWGIVSPGHLQAVEQIMRPVQAESESMSDAEIDAAINEAVDEVRRERKA